MDLAIIEGNFEYIGDLLSGLKRGEALELRRSALISLPDLLLRLESERF